MSSSVRSEETATGECCRCSRHLEWTGDDPRNEDGDIVCDQCHAESRGQLRLIE